MRVAAGNAPVVACGVLDGDGFWAAGSRAVLASLALVSKRSPHATRTVHAALDDVGGRIGSEARRTHDPAPRRSRVQRARERPSGGSDAARRGQRGQRSESSDAVTRHRFGGLSARYCCTRAKNSSLKRSTSWAGNSAAVFSRTAALHSAEAK
jgi:hypothetical protein